jgi:hypothetical protein
MTGFSVRGRNNGPRRVTGEFGSTSLDEAPERPDQVPNGSGRRSRLGAAAWRRCRIAVE